MNIVLLESICVFSCALWNYQSKTICIQQARVYTLYKQAQYFCISKRSGRQLINFACCNMVDRKPYCLILGVEIFLFAARHVLMTLFTTAEKQRARQVQGRLSSGSRSPGLVTLVTGREISCFSLFLWPLPLCNLPALPDHKWSPGDTGPARFIVSLPCLLSKW